MAERIAFRRNRLTQSASVLAMIIGAVTLARWALGAASSLRSGGRYDFSTYYAAAYALRHDPHANIYDATVLAQAGAAAHTFVNPPLAYTYPPLFVLLLSPFTLFPFKLLAALWQGVNDLLWLAIALLLAREIALLLGGRVRLANDDDRSHPARIAMLADPVPWVALALALLLCLPAEPAIQTALTGQINFLVLLPLALVPELERRGHPRWAGTMIALAALLKFTPALLLVYFVLRRRWTVVVAGFVVLAALTLLCVVLVGPGTTLESVAQAFRVGTADASLGHNEALFAPLVTSLSASFPGAASLFRALEYALLALLALAIGYFIWRRGQPLGNIVADATKDAAGYGMALCLMVIVWPTAWVHHYVWALPAAAVALALALAGPGTMSVGARHRRIVALLLAALCCIMLIVPLPISWDTAATPTVTTYLGLPLRPLLLSLRPLATLGLLCLLGYWYATASGANLAPTRGILKASEVASGWRRLLRRRG
jgi:Glycosyltransferase family 87